MSYDKELQYPDFRVNRRNSSISDGRQGKEPLGCPSSVYLQTEEGHPRVVSETVG